MGATEYVDRQWDNVALSYHRFFVTAQEDVDNIVNEAVLPRLNFGGDFDGQEKCLSEWDFVPSSVVPNFCVRLFNGGAAAIGRVITGAGKVIAEVSQCLRE